MIDAIPNAISALHASADVNIDLAIMEARMNGARLSSCASAVDHRGRREVVARDARCRRADARPAANDDDKPEPVLDPLRHFRANPPSEGNHDGSDT